MSDIIVKTNGLCADFKIKDRMVRAVNRVSLSLERGKTLVILGESGSGKSTYMKALLRILPKTAAVEGQAEFLGNDLFRMSEKEFRDIRGNRMAMIYQDSLSALDPMYKVGYQIVETIRAHSSLTKAEARERVEELFVKVGIPSPRERMNAYPHEMSGGMRQRAVIAMALCCNPCLLLADEPTTALDVTIQKQILNLFLELQESDRMSIMMVTHDIGVAAQVGGSDRHHVRRYHSGVRRHQAGAGDAGEPLYQGADRRAPQERQPGAAGCHRGTAAHHCPYAAWMPLFQPLRLRNRGVPQSVQSSSPSMSTI